MKFSYIYYIVQIQKLKGGEHEFTFSKLAKQKKSGGFFTCGKSSDSNVKKITMCTLSNEDINEISNMALNKKFKEFEVKNFFKLNPSNFMKILKAMNSSV